MLCCVARMPIIASLGSSVHNSSLGETLLLLAYPALLLGLGIWGYINRPRCPQCGGDKFDWALRTPKGRISRRVDNTYRCTSCEFVVRTLGGGRRTRSAQDLSRGARARAVSTVPVTPSASNSSTTPGGAHELRDVLPTVNTMAVHDPKPAESNHSIRTERPLAETTIEVSPRERPGRDVDTVTRRETPAIRVLRMKDQIDSYRRAVDATSIEWRHRRIQVELFEYLVRNLPTAFRLAFEQDCVDIMIFGEQSVVVIEVKSGNSATRNIRDALGQSMDYLRRNLGDTPLANSRIIIYGPARDASTHDEYLTFLKSAIAVPLDYCTVGEHQRVLDLVTNGARQSA